MTSLPFYIVDVFAEERYAGNQLAVIRQAQKLSDSEMLKIAKEMNYSETTFILSDEARQSTGEKPGYDVRIFTTVSELPFAGHPTLGTAAVIRDQILKDNTSEIVLNLKVGAIPVTFHQDGVVWMQQRPPEFGATFSAAVMASVLGLEPDEVHDGFPIQSVSTGLPFIIAPLRSLYAVKRAKVNLERFDAMIASVDDPLKADALLVFCPEVYNTANDLNARVFVHHHGAEEDPATGSANGCLAAYLSRHRYFGASDVDCRVEQGYEIDRPSLLMLKAKETEDGIQVNVGGHVVLVAKGELLR